MESVAACHPPPPLMPAYTIPILKKSIAVLKLIAEGRGLTSIKALEQTLGVPHSTMYRMLETFSQEDWVRKTDGGQYELSFGLLPLLQPLMRHELLIETVRDAMLALGRDTGLTTKLSGRQGNLDVTLFHTESPHTGRNEMFNGVRPLKLTYVSCTSSESGIFVHW